MASTGILEEPQYVDVEDWARSHVNTFVISNTLDPGGAKRIEIYAASVKLKSTNDPRFDPTKDPTLAVPEAPPDEAVRRGCRFSTGRGFLDVRFEPPFVNWVAATYCQLATGSAFEYRVTAPDGNYAIYDGKRGSVMYECKCGYNSIPDDINSDNPKKRDRAQRRLVQILRQKENHVNVAKQCGLSVTYKVSSWDLASLLRSAWSDMLVDRHNIVGYTESCER